MTDRHVDDILSDFRELPLPQRMREAAKVLREADRRCHGRIEGWTPLDLEGTAEAWEAED